jgi:hypothetical protein
MLHTRPEPGVPSGNDGAVSSAATQIARERFEHLLARRLWPLQVQGEQGHHEAGSTEATLRGVLIDECLLDGVQGTIRRRQTLDGDELMAVDRR